jgi:hypothetical protein
MLRIVVGVAIVIVLVAGSLEGKTYRVPLEDKDLALALSQARYGDTVLVYPGRYHLEARLRSGIKLISAKGPDSTVLWSRRWYAVLLTDCDLETEVRGFTFQCKGANIAVACTSGAPNIEGNVIRDAWDGISLVGANALVRRNDIRGCNRAISMNKANPEIIENTITKNGEGLSIFSSSPIVSRCGISFNGKGITIAGYSYPTIGGSLQTANDIMNNGFNLYNEGRRIENNLYSDEYEVAVASMNYWGNLCPLKERFRGDVVYTPWVNAEHDSSFNECPKTAPSDSGGSH